MVDPSTFFVDGTHIKASAKKKKYQKEQIKKAAKVYSGQLRREVNAEREKLGKNAIYTPQRLGRSYEMGQAEIYCHESEKAGKYYLFFVPDMPKPQFSLYENWGSLTD